MDSVTQSSVEEEEKPETWPVFELSDEARTKLRDAHKYVRRIPAEAFSLVLDILHFESAFGGNEGDGFYHNRESLQKGLANGEIYGLRISEKMEEALFSTELIPSQQRFEKRFDDFVKKNFPNRWVGCGPKDNVWKKVENIKICCNISKLIHYHRFLPFLCYVDESKFGSIQILWTHSAFRNLGLATCFLEHKFGKGNEKGDEVYPNHVVSEWIAELNLARNAMVPRKNFMPIPELLIPAIRCHATMERVENGNQTTYAHQLLEEMIEFMAATKESIYGIPDVDLLKEIVFEGLMEGRVFLVSVYGSVFRHWPEITWDQLVSQGTMLTNGWRSIETCWIYLPFLCILAKDGGGMEFLWSSRWAACLELEKWVDRKRSAKYIVHSINKEFWNKKGFSTTMPPKECQELEFEDTISGRQFSPILRQGNTKSSSLEWPEDQCEEFAKKVNEILGPEYHCKTIGGVGIRFFSFPGKTEKSSLEIRFDCHYLQDPGVQLRFSWEYAKLDFVFRRQIIDLFMQHYSFLEMVESKQLGYL